MKRIRTIEGIIPPYLHLELIRRNPHDTWHSKNLVTTQELWQKAQPGRLILPRASGRAQVLVYDAKNTQRLPGTRARFEPEAPISDEVLNAIYENCLGTRKFHRDILGINSMDNRGMDYISTGHYGKKYNNALNNGVQMCYGDGDQVIFATFVKPDIDAHECGHQVTKETCDLEYYKWPGILNEHISDVDGAVSRQYNLNLSSAQDSWLIGPGIFMPSISGVALRSMLAPGTAYNDGRLGKDPQPDHMSRFLDTEQDNGGVHINSGIPNKAFAVWSQSAGGYAFEKTYPIWWATRKQIHSDCDFQTFADATVANARQLSPNEVSRLRDAWNAVGIDTK